MPRLTRRDRIAMEASRRIHDANNVIVHARLVQHGIKSANGGKLPPFVENAAKRWGL